MKRTGRVVVMQGVSGAGKSTAAARLLGESAKVAVVASADHYFETRDGYKFDFRKLGEAHAACFRSFVDSLRRMVPVVIVDNTNTTAMEISPYMLGAAAFGYDAEILSVRCNPEVAAARNLHGVPLAGVLAQDKRIREFLKDGNVLGWPVTVVDGVTA